VAQEHFWGGLDTFSFHYFLEFMLPMLVFTSIYAVVTTDPHVAWWGVRKSFNSAILYVDPLVRGCEDAALFFRHLLKPTADSKTNPSILGARFNLAAS